MKIELFEGNWTIEYVKSNTDKIFVFGDNNARVGKGGQAIIRDLSNAIGIRTKKGPSNKPVAFYSDVEFDKNISNFREDILLIKSHILSGKNVVLSKNGYGTGLAQLEKMAPKTYFNLCQLLYGHFGFENSNGVLKRRIPGYDEIVTGTYVSLDNKKFESNVLNPINNSYFRPEYLSKEINTLFDLITKGKKIAFTYPVSHNIGDIVILSVADSHKYLVCRVVDSYYYKSISKDMWSLFEGFDGGYIDNLKLLDDTQKLYQNHIDFICTLDETGKMEFNQDLFGDSNITSDKVKVIGETISPSVVDSNDVGILNYIKKKITNFIKK